MNFRDMKLGDYMDLLIKIRETCNEDWFNEEQNTLDTIDSQLKRIDQTIDNIVYMNRYYL